MNIPSVETVWLELQNLELFVAREMERQLQGLPQEVVKGIDPTQALKKVRKFLPLESYTALGERHQGQGERIRLMLQELITDAVSLELLRSMYIPPKSLDVCVDQ